MIHGQIIPCLFSTFTFSETIQFETQLKRDENHSTPSFQRGLASGISISVFSRTALLHVL